MLYQTQTLGKEILKWEKIKVKLIVERVQIILYPFKKKKESVPILNPKFTDRATIALHEPFEDAFFMKNMNTCKLFNLGLVNELFQTYHTGLD